MSVRLAAMVIVLSVGCGKSDRRADDPVAKAASVAKAAPAAYVEEPEVEPKFPTPSPEDVATVEVAAKVALAMCRKDLDDVTPADVRTHGRFVAALMVPGPTVTDVAADPWIAFQDAYLAAGTFPFVTTGAAIHIWAGPDRKDAGFGMMVVGDGSDPCKADEMNRVSALGNPALKLTLLRRLGEQSTSEGGSVNGPTQRQAGAGYIRIDRLDKGVGATLSVHTCFDQEPILADQGAGAHLPARYFAIGRLEATWCPGAEP